MSTEAGPDVVRLLKMNVAEHYAAVTTRGGRRELYSCGRCY